MSSVALAGRSKKQVWTEKASSILARLPHTACKREETGGATQINTT